ncbi:MAG: sulfur oxidation c-type cytochrome SoxA [Rhodocyclaceae bacterium]|nr:sulfur oxidation c-type cytochrome SoxA [Rhodocyclaceae bacterium]
MKGRLLISAAVVSLGMAGMAWSQGNSATAEIEKYREMLGDGNPAELFEMDGEALWATARGPKNASLQKCDLGLGAGVVKGAYAQMPRYFADSDKVEDLESRLMTCMVKLQGFDRAELSKKPFGTANYKSDMEALVAYVVGQSRGMPMAVPTAHPKEKAAFELGKQIFFYRAGPYDFSCATCHAMTDARIRMQDLPDLTSPAGSQRAYTSWPAYRVSQSLFRSFQWRLNDCFRQQRFPEPTYASESTIALTSYLATMANGATYQGPGIKR